MAGIRKISLGQGSILTKETKATHRTLRHATLEDIPLLLEFAEALFDEAPLAPVRIDLSKVRAQLERLIASNQKEGLVLVSHDNGTPVGALVGIAHSPLFTSDLIASEVLWYLKPEFRKGRRGIDMMQAFEYWAKLIGCVTAQYGQMTTSPANLDSLYKWNNARLAEKIYFKDLV